MTLARTLSGLAIAFCAAAPALAEVKIALDSPQDLERNGQYVWVHTFAEHLNANGMEAVEYQRGALGGEAERLDQVSTGLLEVSSSNVVSVGTLEPLTYGALLPYLFRDIDHLDAAMEAANLMARINEGTTPQGVRLLGLAVSGPPIGIHNTKKPIASLDDMAGLRMRALDERQIELYAAWGATGTIVSWAEVPNALQTGVADGYLNAANVPLIVGHTDFLKHFTDASVNQALRAIIVSEAWYQGLGDEERAVVDEAARLAHEANRAWLPSQSDVLDQLAAAGVTVTSLDAAERARFEEASRAIYRGGRMDDEDVDFWIEAAAAVPADG